MKCRYDLSRKYLILAEKDSKRILQGKKVEATSVLNNAEKTQLDTAVTFVTKINDMVYQYSILSKGISGITTVTGDSSISKALPVLSREDICVVAEEDLEELCKGKYRGNALREYLLTREDNAGPELTGFELKVGTVNDDDSSVIAGYRITQRVSGGYKITPINVDSLTWERFQAEMEYNAYHLDTLKEFLVCW